MFSQVIKTTLTVLCTFALLGAARPPPEALATYYNQTADSNSIFSRAGTFTNPLNQVWIQYRTHPYAPR